MFGRKDDRQPKYPGIRMAVDGNTAVILCEREASDAAGAYPITPSTPMGEIWAEEVAKGHLNISGRPLIFIEPESEHAAAAVTAGMAMTGLRATNFSSAQGVAFMHESLYAAVGKRLPYVLNIGARAITKASLNVHCAHDDYHCIDDTGFIQVFARNAQEAADLNLIARKLAELSLTPAAVAQDGFLTTHLIEPIQAPERALIETFCGRPDDLIECPTPAQRLLFGPTRRRVPALWDVDDPLSSGTVQNQDAYMQSVAAQRPYFFDHIPRLADQVMAEYEALTGRRHARVSGYRWEDAEYLILGQGSMTVQAEAVADYLRESRRLKVGVLNLTMFRPFPGELLARMIRGKQGVAVLERVDQPLAEDLPILVELRAALTKCLENGMVGKHEPLPYPDYPAYRSGDMPRLYSGCYGLGSRDLQPEALIAAVENMLPGGGQRRFFYLSIDFVREPVDPQDEIRIQALKDAYPEIGRLALRGSENPNLLPQDAITVRMHSVGGWGAVTTGKNLAMTLYELLGWHIRANPKYGSEKKGQPTTYFLAAAPEPIRLNCEYTQVDVVLSPDPNVFTHSNPLAGLKPGGCFIIQSNLDSPEQVWAGCPPAARQFIVEHGIRVYYLDGFKIAREEATNPELQFRMQGAAFQGAFFAVSNVMERLGLTETGLFAAIEEQLRAKFGAKGERVVQDNLRVVRRGFDELTEITEKPLDSDQPLRRRMPPLPILLKTLPEGSGRISDAHRFWEQTGILYARGRANDNLADPQMALSLLPAATGVYRDLTQIRFEYPRFIPERCTACGSCVTVCPDSAIPGLVSRISEILATAINRVEHGMPTRFLRRESRALEKRLRTLIDSQGEGADVRTLLDRAILDTLAAFEGDAAEKSCAEREFALMRAALGDYPFAITRPYWTNREKQQLGSGGLFSVTVNPYTCKGCMECVEVCKDGALVAAQQTDEAVEHLRTRWALWLELPNTAPEFIRIESLDDKIGALATLLLDKTNYLSMVGGDGACMGCGEKTAVHLFTATVTALMQPRVKRHVAELEDLIARLETQVRLKLAAGMDLSNAAAIQRVLEAHQETDLTLAELSSELIDRAADPVDPDWLKWVTDLLAKLRRLRDQYTAKRPRAAMGFVNATGCSSVWGGTFPYNPYPFPWSNNLFQDSPSIALGLFEGHMRKMAEGFKAIRQARMELAGRFNLADPACRLDHFTWRDFSEEEWRLCPPVVAVGGDGAMYDIGFQNLSRALLAGLPIKILVLDTQSYSNTGGQSCTSGFWGQVADMAPYGQTWKGKKEIRKEMGLIGMAHRSAFVLSSATSHLNHLLEGLIDGLNSRRPALFNLYTPCQPEHGIGDALSDRQARLAVESRAYPLFRFDPDAGTSFEECCSIDGNPVPDADWVTWTLNAVDGQGKPVTLEVPFTFADFAMTEGRFRKHFRKIPEDAWNDSLLPLHEFIDLPEEGRAGLHPYIWGLDHKNRLMRVMVAPELVQSCEERRAFWRQLRGLCGLLGRVDVEAIRAQAKVEIAQRLASILLALAGEGGIQVAGSLSESWAAETAAPPTVGRDNGSGGNGASPAAAAWESAWVETPACTACDECIRINPRIFRYNAAKRVEIADPKGGPYRDIVKAAEQCPAGCIHPGLPWNPGEQGVEQLIKRAAKYQ